MFGKSGRIVVLFLLSGGLLAGNAMSAPSDDPCKGKKTDRPASCGGEETPGGEHNSLQVTLGDDGSGRDQIYGDGSAVYSDSEKTVNAQLGGQTQPNAPGFSLGLKKAGRNPRELTTELACTALPGGLNNCNLLEAFVTDDELSIGVRPYEVNCPGGGECPDIFTMGTGSALMSFRANYWNHNIFVEIASAIDGDGSLKPGRCLSLLDEIQKGAFLDEFCAGTPGKCNVRVTAYDDGDIAGAGAEDGENDEWLVSAYGPDDEILDGPVALICGLLQGSEVVYGMTVMEFGIHAIKE